MLPTGGGKTHTFAYIAEHAAERGNRVLVLTHRQEIRDQISTALSGMGVRHGLIAPGHSMTDDMAQVAMVQTAARRVDRIAKPALIVVDEAHHAVAGSWSNLMAAWPAAKVLGVTASPLRLDGRGLGDAFGELVEGPTVAELIAQGWLSGFTVYAPPSGVDVSGARTERGDYSIHDLAEIMDRATITGCALTHYQKLGGGMPALAFCTTIAHSQHVAAQFRAGGVAALHVDGKTPEPERRRAIEAFRRGELRMLSNVDLYGEGVDVPAVGVIIDLRPTKSLSRAMQTWGRALRPDAAKTAAVILDHVGNTHRHGLPDSPREWTLAGRARRQAAPGVSQCKLCYRVFPVAGTPGTPAACPERATGLLGQPLCPYLEPSAAERAPPEQVAGELVAVTAVQPAWLPAEVGIRSAPLAEVVSYCRTKDHLQEVARARGYKGYWVVTQLRLMRERRAKVARADQLGLAAIAQIAARARSTPHVPREGYCASCGYYSVLNAARHCEACVALGHVAA